MATLGFRGYETIENLEALINSEQELLMPTKVSQRFIIDKIEQYETFPHHPKTMKLDINRKIYYEQLNIEYNDINKKSQIVDDGLKLNLFLNHIIRAEKIKYRNICRRTEKCIIRNKTKKDDN